MHVVDVRELVVGAALAIEQSQHRHAADVFLQMRVDARDGDADAAIRVTHFDTEHLRGIDDQRKHRKSDERQLPVHHRHDGDDSGQHEDVLENGNHAGSEQLVKGIHVGGDARDKASNRVLVVKADVHMLQMTENLAAQVEHDFVSGPLHEVGLRELKDKAQSDNAGVDPPNLRNTGICVRTEEAV